MEGDGQGVLGGEPVVDGDGDGVGLGDEAGEEGGGGGAKGGAAAEASTVVVHDEGELFGLIWAVGCFGEEDTGGEFGFLGDYDVFGLDGGFGVVEGCGNEGGDHEALDTAIFVDLEERGEVVGYFAGFGIHC